MAFQDTGHQLVRVHMLDDDNGNRIYAYKDCDGDLRVRFESKNGQMMDVADNVEELRAVIDFLQDLVLPTKPKPRSNR